MNEELVESLKTYVGKYISVSDKTTNDTYYLLLASLSLLVEKDPEDEEDVNAFLHPDEGIKVLRFNGPGFCIEDSVMSQSTELQLDIAEPDFDNYDFREVIKDDFIKSSKLISVAINSLLSIGED